MDADDLMREFKDRNMKFDRISVANISDENHIGLKRCLELA
jgi:hypothetical protein